MFYSHEILTNPKYGVATIWMVATLGPKVTARKKVTRRAIQDVDVQKACDTILKPGAPIALRLQGNLLFGVSKVYSSQCAYVLGDAEKVQTQIQATFGQLDRDTHFLSDSARDRTKNKQQLVLADDPLFDINGFEVPPFRLDDAFEQRVSRMGAETSQIPFSQLSPPVTLSGNSAGSGFPPAFIDDFDLPSGSSRDKVQLQSPFGKSQRTLSRGPLSDDVMILDDEKVDRAGLQDQDDMLPMHDVLQMDEEGNLTAKDLPWQLQDQNPLEEGLNDDGRAGPSRPAQAAGAAGWLGQEDLGGMNAAQPSGRAERSEDIYEPQRSSLLPMSPPPEDHARQVRRRPRLVPDHRVELQTEVIRQCGENYAARMHIENLRRLGRLNATTAAQARANAYQAVFSVGLGNVGVPLCNDYPALISPLAEIHAGEGLEDKMDQSRRRSASQAFDEDEDDVDEVVRNVRPRHSSSEAAEHGRQGPISSQLGAHTSPGFLWDFNDGGPGVPDHTDYSILDKHRSGNTPSPVTPWPYPALLDSFQFSGSGHTPSRADFRNSGGGGGDGLDNHYACNLQVNLVTLAKTVPEDMQSGCHWLDFDDVLKYSKPLPTRHDAAAVFLGVLTLGTRNKLKVRQEDGDDEKAFGVLYVGVFRDDLTVSGKMAANPDHDNGSDYGSGEEAAGQQDAGHHHEEDDDAFESARSQDEEEEL